MTVGQGGAPVTVGDRTGRAGNRTWLFLVELLGSVLHRMTEFLSLSILFWITMSYGTALRIRYCSIRTSGNFGTHGDNAWALDRAEQWREMAGNSGSAISAIRMGGGDLGREWQHASSRPDKLRWGTGGAWWGTGGASGGGTGGASRGGHTYSGFPLLR